MVPPPGNAPGLFALQANALLFMLKRHMQDRGIEPLTQA